MSTIMNPYIAGAPVTETRMFFGREDVFDWIQNSLTGKYSDHILVVHGQRRVGKTSVLKQLGNRLPEKFIPVFFDLQGRTHTTLPHFLWWLARETVRVLKQERGIEVPLPEKEDFAKDPEYFENTFLPGLKPSLGKSSLLYTFDEFDNLEESDVKEELALPLTDYLRRLMGRGEMNFIFSIGSSGRKLENMQAAYTEFFKTALYKKISFLSKEQTHGLVTRPVEGVIEYDANAVERIYGIASGHPYFTQLTCHELFARCQRTDQRKIALADVDSVLDDVVERGTVNLKFVWDEASDLEKWSLAALAGMEKFDNRLLADFLRRQRVRFSESDLTSGLLHLREKDVLTPDNHFVIQLLRLWLQKNRPIEQVREELTEANPIANRYIEIGQEFKDAGQFAKAIDSFRDALNISANNLQAQVNIALTYTAQGHLEQAVIEFEKALAIDDEDVSSRSGLCDAHLALGDAAMKKGKTKEASLSYQRVLAINAEHLEARQRMAELSRQRAEKALVGGKDEEALGAFSEALNFTPEDAVLLKRVEKVRAEKNAKVLAAQVGRSEKEAGAGNWDKAIVSLYEALEVAPGDAKILDRIAKIKEQQQQEQLDAILAKVNQAEKAGRWEAAIAGLNDYLRLKPEDAAIQKRIADLVEAKHTAWQDAVLKRVDQAVTAQNWDEALSVLNEALRLEPENIGMQAKVIQVQESQHAAEFEAMLKAAAQAAQEGHWDEAIDILNNGLASNPNDETVKTRLAEARQAKREERLKAALRLADSAAQAGKWESAAASLEEVLANEPDNTEFQGKLAEIKRLERESKLNALRTQAGSLLKAEKFKESLAAWETYLALEPDDREDAQAQIEAVKKVQNLSALYAEASGAYAKKDYEKAIELFKRIVVEDAEHKDTTDLLAESVRLRRTGHKTSAARLRRIWLTGGLIGILALAIGGGVYWLGRTGRLSLSTIFATKDTSALAGTTITVTSLEDSGPGTLRQALQDAQNGDTITFDPSVFPPGRPATIFLTSGSLELGGLGKGYLTLDASNAGVILDGSQAGDGFDALYIDSFNNVVMGLRIVNFSGRGIVILGNNNRIGGDRAVGAGSLGQGNLIGNNGTGIELPASAGGNVITGNYIGIDEFGQAMGNQDGGIRIMSSGMAHVSPNIIGPDNTIAYNGGPGGIVIETVELPTTITSNIIFGNEGPGIYYAVDEAARTKYATPPVILEFNREAGTVRGDACPDCSVDIFSTDSSDGQYFEGSLTADTDGHFLFEKGGALTGAFPTATLTRDDKYTSEFSQVPAPTDILLAWEAIQTWAPDYQSGFEEWIFTDDEEQARLEGARLEDGQLVITSTGDHVAVTLDTPDSDMFAVQYDFLATDTSDSRGHCIFYNALGDNESNLATGFYFDRSMTLDFQWGGGGETLAAGSYNSTISNTVTRIVLGDQVAEFLNGRLVYSASDPRLDASYARSMFAVHFPITCAYDNFAYWDLSGLELSSNVDITLAWDTIQDREPDYQSGFDEWVFNDDGGARLEGARLEDGQLVITSTGDLVLVYLDTPESDMFAVQYDIFATDSSDSRGHCIFYNDPGDFSILLNTVFYFDRSMMLDFDSGGGGETLATGTFDPSISNTVTRIVLGDQVAEFLNGRLVYSVSDPRLRNNYARSIFAVNYPITCAFDNFAYWDLSGLGDPSAAATDESTSQPDWMTDFFTPIYESTHSRHRDYGGGGIIDYRDWLDTDCVYPQVDMSSEVYELFLDCQFADWKYWLTDFLIEMEVRMEPLAEGDPGSDWTFHFRGWQGYRFSFSGEISALDLSIPDAYQNPEQYNHIVIIVKDQETALVVNGEPIFYGALEPGYESGVAHFSGESVTFKYINIWDLNK